MLERWAKIWLRKAGQHPEGDGKVQGGDTLLREAPAYISGTGRQGRLTFFLSMLIIKQLCMYVTTPKIYVYIH